MLHLLLTIPTAYAHGIWGHIHVTGWAIEHIDQPEIMEFFSDPAVKNAALFGASFTDSGYFPFVESTAQYSHIYAEYTHWEPFVEDYILWMQQYDPPPFTTLESKKRVAFLMGAAAHGLQDELFDSLFLYRTEEEDGHGQDTIDPASDGFLSLDGELRFFPEEDLPLEVLLDIYAPLSEQITAEILQESVSLMLALYVNEENGPNLAAQLAQNHIEDLSWSRLHYLDPDIPGSLHSEIIPSARYIEAIWDRLHLQFDEEDVLIATYPQQHRRLNSIDHTTAASWITAIFGAGVRRDNIQANWKTQNGTEINFNLEGTRWGHSWTRLVRLLPQEDLDHHQRYDISLSGIHTQSDIIGAYTFPVLAPCSTPCTSFPYPESASRTPKEESLTPQAQPQGCQTFPYAPFSLLCTILGIAAGYNRQRLWRTPRNP